MNKRRYDIDWIRVIVFDILIFWHVGLFFVSWENLVPWDLPLKNNIQVSWLIWPMLFVRQWRLPILFLVSGIGTRFSLSSKTGLKYLKNRFIRLFIPLLAGMFLIVPPQVYLERLVQGVEFNSFFEFYPSIFQDTYPEGNFSWGHLWFLVYLLVMSVIALPVFVLLRDKGKNCFSFFKSLIEKSPTYLYVFVFPLIVIEITLESKFPLTMNLINDWYAFSYYFACLFIGFFLANLGDSLWNAVIKIRRLSLLVGIFASIYVLFMLSKNESPVLVQVLKPLNVWSWILAIFGYSSTYLNRKSNILSYRNTAVYPFYILHFTITLFLGYILKDHSIHYSIKMVIMVIGTFGISWLLYEYFIKRIGVLRPLFGINNRTI